MPRLWCFTVALLGAVLPDSKPPGRSGIVTVHAIFLTATFTGSSMGTLVGRTIALPAAELSVLELMGTVIYFHSELAPTGLAGFYLSFGHRVNSGEIFIVAVKVRPQFWQVISNSER